MSAPQIPHGHITNGPYAGVPSTQYLMSGIQQQQQQKKSQGTLKDKSAVQRHRTGIRTQLSYGKTLK